MMNKSDDWALDAELTQLHDSHIWHANAAVAAGRDDVAWSGALEFPDEALRLIIHSRRAA